MSTNEQSMGIRDNTARVTDAASLKAAPTAGGVTAPGVPLTPFEQKLLRAMDESERKAWDSLSKYKFWMFGYHAGAWVRDNRFGGFKRPNPFKALVQFARAQAKPVTP